LGNVVGNNRGEEFVHGFQDKLDEGTKRGLFGRGFLEFARFRVVIKVAPHQLAENFQIHIEFLGVFL